MATGKMTYFVRFIRSSLTSARRAIGSSNYSNQQNGLRCVFDKLPKRSKKSFLTTASHSYGDYGSYNNASRCKASVLLGASFAFLGFFENEEKKEPALITTIKRSILLIQVFGGALSGGFDTPVPGTFDCEKSAVT